MVKSINLGDTVTELGNLFNSFRNNESKDDAIGHLFKKFTSVAGKFKSDIFSSAGDNKFAELAGNIAKSAMKSTAVSGGLLAAGVTEGLSAIPAIFEAVIDGVVGLYSKAQETQESFFPGEWITMQRGFVDDPEDDMRKRDLMFGEATYEMQIPNYNVGFFIEYSGHEAQCMVFDAKEGKVNEIPVSDVRSAPDQTVLDSHPMLRDIKEVYFKKEGKNALAKTQAEVSIGKDVMFKDILYNVLEFEPVKQLVHLVRDGEVVQTALQNIQNFDASNTLTWLNGNTLEQAPRTLVKWGYCWVQNENVENLYIVTRIVKDVAELIDLETGKPLTTAVTRPIPASPKFGEMLASLPEFRRFRKHVIAGLAPEPIWKYRYLCKQTTMNRYIDKMDKTDLKSAEATERHHYGIVPDDLSHEVIAMELAYNEKIEIDEMENF